MFIGNVYIADYMNSRIRKVTVSTGVISTIAGTGTNSYSGDGGAATSASLFRPGGVTVDSFGKIPFYLYFYFCYLIPLTYLQATCTSLIISISVSAR